AFLSAWAMRWFRSRVRLCALLALFALAIQFALSFGHVHVPGIKSKVAGGIFFALLVPQPVADLGATAPTPANPHPKGYLGDTCTICTLIQMAGSAPPPVVAQLPLPLAVGEAAQFIAMSVALDATPHTLAQARAPPIA